MKTTVLHEKWLTEEAAAIADLTKGEAIETDMHTTFKLPPEQLLALSFSYLERFNGLKALPHEEPMLCCPTNAVELSLSNLTAGYFVLPENPREHYLTLMKNDGVAVARYSGEIYVSDYPLEVDESFTPIDLIYTNRMYPLLLERRGICSKKDVDMETQSAPTAEADIFLAGLCQEDAVGTTCTYTQEYRLSMAVLYMEKVLGFDYKKGGLPIFINSNGKRFDFSALAEVYYGFPAGKPDDHYMILVSDPNSGSGTLYVFGNGETLLLRNSLHIPDDCYFWDSDKFSVEMRNLFRHRIDMQNKYLHQQIKLLAQAG